VYFCVAFLKIAWYHGVVEITRGCYGMQTDRKSIGARLRARREYLRMTQQDVADQLFMNRVTYAQYEQGRNEMAVSDLPRIAKVLKVKPEYFFGPAGDDDPSADHDPNSDAPTDDEEGEVLRYFHGIPPMMRPAAKAMLKGLMDAEPDYEEGRVFGRKAE
jgi:transcriptional regulator with XRE-family HTH domain